MDNSQVKKWIEKGPSLSLLEATEDFGKSIAQGKGKLTTSQIRQIFTRLKALQAKGYANQRTEFMMLKPYIAYAAGRHRSDGINALKEKITWGIEAVISGAPETEELRFSNFCKFFEAILAYHRAHGGN